MKIDLNEPCGICGFALGAVPSMHKCVFLPDVAPTKAAGKRRPVDDDVETDHVWSLYRVERRKLTALRAVAKKQRALLVSASKALRLGASTLEFAAGQDDPAAARDVDKMKRAADRIAALLRTKGRA